MATSVPDTSTFTLQNVVDVVGGTSLTAAFANASDGYFDATYKGSKDRLSNFRNYTESASAAAEVTSVWIQDGYYPDDIDNPIRGEIIYDCTVAGKVQVSWDQWDGDWMQPDVSIASGTINDVDVVVGTSESIDFTSTSFIPIDYVDEEDVFFWIFAWIGGPGDRPDDFDAAGDSYRNTTL